MKHNLLYPNKSFRNLSLINYILFILGFFGQLINQNSKTKIKCKKKTHSRRDDA